MRKPVHNTVHANPKNGKHAYSASMQAVAFAGPSYLPKKPSALWPSAVHMSDVSFFWEAPALWGTKAGLVSKGST